MDGAPAIRLCDISKRFGTRWAVTRLSYTLIQGRSLLLTGHNGSGKTTLLRMLATATFPTAGTIELFGHDTRAHREPLRRKVALISHASFLYEDLTAAQNLTFLAHALRLSDAAGHVRSLLDRVQLSARASSPVRQFSAGMRKRLAIARLLMKSPTLALFDEPFGELDPSGITQMESLLKELQQQGTSLVLATHLIEQGESLTQERLHLHEGRKAEP